jgi:hypothetical protein
MAVFLIQYDNESRPFFSFYFEENENPAQRRSNPRRENERRFRLWLRQVAR